MWAESKNKVIDFRPFHTELLNCPKIKSRSSIRWFVNDKRIVERKYSKWNRVSLSINSQQLYFSNLYEDDLVKCDNCTSSNAENCITENVPLHSKVKYGETSFCSEHGIVRNGSTVGGINIPICDCFHGYRGEYCEVEINGKHSLIFALWSIVLIVMASLIFALIRHENQTRFRPPTNNFRFVDILNGALEI